MESNHIGDYLKDSRYVDFRSDNIRKEAGHLYDGCDDECARIKAAFEFVRDADFVFVIDKLGVQEYNGLKVNISLKLYHITPWMGV